MPRKDVTNDKTLDCNYGAESGENTLKGFAEKKAVANHQETAKLLFSREQSLAIFPPNSLRKKAKLPRGVIGNTAGFGPAILGSSPSGVALMTTGNTVIYGVPFFYARK